MKFSVLISCYFKENPDFLRQALESCVNQTLLPDEIVLVKDGPLTNSLEEVISMFSLKNEGLLKIVALEENVGLGAALSIGILQCSFDHVIRMDTDDISRPKRFETQVKFAKKNPTIDVFGGYIEEFRNKPGDLKRYRKTPLTDDLIKNYIKKSSPMNHVTVMFKKAKVINAGNYETFYGIEDCHLWARMMKNQSKFANIPEVLVDVRFNTDVLKRRKNFNYLKAEIKQHYFYYNTGIISLPRLVANITIRSCLRFLPSRLLDKFYAITRK